MFLARSDPQVRPPVRFWLQGAFPRPGEAMAAAGVVLASATLGSLGLLAASLAEPTAAVELGRQPVLTERAATDPSVAVVPPSPPPPPERSAHTHPPAPLVPARSSSVQTAGLTRLHRVSPASSTLLAPPVAVPKATELAGSPRLTRMSRHQVLAAIPALANGAHLADAGALPLGMGMWLYVPEEIEGGSVDALVARARQVGLTHVYVRTGSSRGGFYARTT